MDVSVVVVNYNTSAFLEPLIRSLNAQCFVVDGRPGTLEIILIDNASQKEDHEHLERLASGGVRFIRNTENVGYGIANNQGFHVARGRWHVVCNPDVIVAPGCLQTLIESVEGLSGAAIVGPLASMDTQGEVLLPPNELPDPYLESLIALASYLHPIARFNARRRARFAHRYWTARAPIPMPMLSGSFFLGRRATFVEHGLFDPSFPLYYEDTDLFSRYHSLNLGLWHVPSARIVHHFSRSALTRMKAAMHRNQFGVRRYFQKHFGSSGLRAYLDGASRAARLARDHECPWELEERPPSSEAPKFEVPDTANAYLEIAANPKFSLTAGIFPIAGGSYQLPTNFWEQLACTHYWVRAVDPADGDTLHAWRVTKCPTN